MDKSACRLYLFFARESSIAVILRRGPSKWVQFIRWDTATDIFEPGHWFKGMIYPERCDLSPLGDKFIYFAAKHDKYATADPAYTHTWTAISKPPYLTALALWTNRKGTYFGGGLFATEDRIQLNALDLAYWGNIPEPHPEHRPPPGVTVESFPMPWHAYHRFRLDSEYLRLLRDGWTWHEDGRQFISFSTLQRRAESDLPMPLNLYRYGGMPAGGAILHRQIADPNDSYYIHSGTLSDARDELLEGVRWADFDHRGRLICAADGKLFAVELATRKGTRVWREIADFNANKPYLRPPPESAKVW